METKVYSNDVDHYRAPSYSHATAFWIVVNKQITISILLGIVVLLSLVGNILVVVASVLYVRLRSLMSIFILNLALSDLLFTVGMLFWICDYIWHLDLGDTVCKMYRFFFSVGCYSNVVFQVLMSFQRYMAVVHPRTGWKKGQSVKDVLICAWVMSILAALPVTVHFKTYPYLEGCTYSSDTAFAASMYKGIFVFLCSFLFMAFCYIRILQNIKSTTNQEHKTTGLAFTLSATYFVFWGPYSIVTFMTIFSDYHQMRFFTENWTDKFYSRLSLILSLTRCCHNPLIYGLFISKFSKTTREIFQRRATPNPLGI
ncbi:chemokine XC receptor 1-like [Silurus meridionalis]|uniref:chemokine XC receptor 1-like n=1 Tax=Silurus meridionalis TaxID=175797 RepID=UPI001EEBB8EF|nr:chemokine XC receptor 1-like [Silurus meridionalis]